MQIEELQILQRSEYLYFLELSLLQVLSPQEELCTTVAPHYKFAYCKGTVKRIMVLAVCKMLHKPQLMTRDFMNMVDSKCCKTKTANISSETHHVLPLVNVPYLQNRRHETRAELHTRSQHYLYLVQYVVSDAIINDSTANMWVNLKWSLSSLLIV